MCDSIYNCVCRTVSNLRAISKEPNEKGVALDVVLPVLSALDYLHQMVCQIRTL